MIMTEDRRVDHRRLDPMAVLERIRQTDLRGHGGGGFPTAVKIDSARGARPRLIVNASDSEPLLDKDAAILRHRPGLLADGITLVASMVQAREVVIAVHAAAEADAKRLRQQLPGRVRTMIVPDRYVAGEASALASLAAGGPARPVFHDRPLTAGGPGRGRTPVLVLNAETLARVALTALGPVVPTRLITIAGAVRRTGLIETGTDSRVGDLVAADATPRAVLLGGYGGRWLPWEVAAPRSLAELGADLGAGLIMVAGPECPLPMVGRILGYLADQTAGQCGPCVFGLPAVAADWQQLAHPVTAGAARERLARRLPVIGGRGGCAHPDGAVRMAASALATFGPHLDDHAADRCARTPVAA